MSSCKRNVCNTDVHRASYVKHLRSEKHLENMKQKEIILPDWFFKEPVDIKNKKKVYNPKPLKQIAKENFKLDVEQLKKDLSKK